MRFLPLMLLFGFSACTQPAKHNLNAKQLNDSAVAVIMHSQDYNKGFALLDEAVKMDSNYSNAYANKLSFQLELDQYENALETAKNLKRINPGSPIYYATSGFIYYKMKDSISSQKYFREAATCYDKMLDTMGRNNKKYDILLLDKAVNLIIIDKQKEGNEILKQLYNKKTGENDKALIASFMNKSKQEFLDTFNQK